VKGPRGSKNAETFLTFHFSPFPHHLLFTILTFFQCLHRRMAPSLTNAANE